MLINLYPNFVHITHFCTADEAVFLFCFVLLILSFTVAVYVRLYKLCWCVIVLLKMYVTLRQYLNPAIDKLFFNIYLEYDFLLLKNIFFSFSQIEKCYDLTFPLYFRKLPLNIWDKWQPNIVWIGHDTYLKHIKGGAHP